MTIFKFITTVKWSKVKKCKYLGVLIDLELSGESMFSYTMSKVNSRLKFLYRYKTCLNRALRKQLCTALVLCHLDYCSTSWFPNLTSFQKHKLQIAVNKVSRYILDFTPRTHIGQSELNQIGILKEQVDFFLEIHNSLDYEDPIVISERIPEKWIPSRIIIMTHKTQQRAVDFFNHPANNWSA